MFLVARTTLPVYFKGLTPRAATIHRCTGEPRYFLSRYEYRYLNGISLYRKTTKYFSSKIKNLLYQHSGITVLISFMTSYPSTSLFLSHVASSLLSIASHASNHVFFKMAARKHAWFKLSADTVLCARSKNTLRSSHWFVRHVFLKSNSNVPCSKDNPFGLLGLTPRAATIHRCTGELRYFLSRYEYRYLNGISLYRETTKYFSSKIKNLLYQHSGITVLISFMTSYPSTSLFLSHVASSLLSIASHASNHVFFKMAARKHA